MYLVDTSVWIDFLREKDTVAVRLFTEIIEKKLPYGITSIIYQEILQGAESKKDFQSLIEYLQVQRFYEPKDSILSYQAAAELYLHCREKGITIRSAADCLIAQVAIEHKLLLLHNDKDYSHLSKVIPELEIAHPFN